MSYGLWNRCIAGRHSASLQHVVSDLGFEPKPWAYQLTVLPATLPEHTLCKWLHECQWGLLDFLKRRHIWMESIAWSASLFVQSFCRIELQQKFFCNSWSPKLGFYQDVGFSWCIILQTCVIKTRYVDGDDKQLEMGENIIFVSKLT